MKNKSQISPIGKLCILGTIFGVPLLFFVFSQGLKNLITVSPLIILASIIVIITVYTAGTTRIVYKFYGVKPPVISYLPCIGELSLTTKKYTMIGYTLYTLAFICIAISLAPYNIIKIFGVNALQSIPFFMMLIALILLFVVQIIKGIGMSIVFMDIEESWFETMHTGLGLLRRYKLLLFLPFIRVIGLYGIRKPIETLIVFNDNLVGSSDVLEEDT